jgi:hypothetical protein
MQHVVTDETASQGSTGAAAAVPAKHQATARARGRVTGAGNASDGPENANNLFASGDSGVWAYLQDMDEKLKSLTAEVEAGKRNETHIMEKLTASELRVSALTVEVEALRRQLSGPHESPAPQQ